MSTNGIVFHHFHDRIHPRGQGAISADDLDAMIRFLGRDNILDARDWIKLALGGELKDNQTCFTFDDALRCQYDVALPVLRRHGIAAFWFIYSSVFEGGVETLEIYRYFRTVAFPTIDDFYADFFARMQSLYAAEYNQALAGFDPDSYLSDFPFYSRNDRKFRYVRDDVLRPGRYNALMDSMMLEHGFDTQKTTALLWMNDQNLRTLHSEGHVVGLHSYTHPTRIAEYPAARQRDEYERNCKHLTKVLGTAPIAMSHPCGSYTSDTLNILRSLGIVVGFGDHPGVASSSLEFPRENHATVMRQMGR